MKLMAGYKDPKKRWLQRIEIGLLCLLLPIAAFWVTSSTRIWLGFREAEKLYDQGELLIHQNRAREAVQYFEASVKACPQFLRGWQSLGVTYHFLNDHKKEAETFRRAVEVFPDEHLLHRDLATVLHEIGDHQAELEHLNIAAQLPVVDEIFMAHLLKRAKAEAAGTYPKTPSNSRNGALPPHESRVYPQVAWPSKPEAPGP